MNGIDSFDDLTPDCLRATAEIVYRKLLPTPQLRWPLLEKRCGCELWLKHENHLPTGAFKVRGGLAYFHQLRSCQPPPERVIAATRGNHGQSIAFAAGLAGIAATIVVPEGNSAGKNRAMEALGASLLVHGSDFDQALERAGGLATERGWHLVPSLDWRLVAGVASWGLELFVAVPELEIVYVPVGLGSGICGLAAARRACGARAEIVGVVAERAPAYARSFAAGRPVPIDELPDTIADGLACRVPDKRAVAVILEQVARFVTVSEEQIAEAMRVCFTDAHQIAEGAGAAAVAAVLAEPDRVRGKKVAAVLTGGNVDGPLYVRVLSG